MVSVWRGCESILQHRRERTVQATASITSMVDQTTTTPTRCFRSRISTMSEQFDQLHWHDAVILSIEIDRRRPGENDEVLLRVVWPDNQRERIRFFGCYGLEASLNFGMVAAETVVTADEFADTEGLKTIRDNWGRLGVDLATLKCFSIEMNSTASKIAVYAQGWSRDHDRDPP